MYTTIISLVQGCRDAFYIIREFKGLPQNHLDEQKWRSDIVEFINDNFHFQHFRNKDSRERGIYEKLIGESIFISQELIDNFGWRNKFAHKVPFFNKRTKYPSKEDVLNFIVETDKVVNFIDSKIEDYKSEWLREF